MDIHVSQEGHAAEKEFAYAMTHVLRDACRTHHRALLLLVSGGSVMQTLDFIDTNVLEGDVTIGVIDERYDPTNETSNFAQLKKTQFYRRAHALGCRFTDTSTREEVTKEEFARLFETQLRAWRTENPDGHVVALLGMGGDGHTAGIFPFPENQNFFHELFEGENWVVAYDAGEKSPYHERVTVTLSFFHEIDFAVVFVVGQSKREAFRMFLSNGSCADVPARAIKTLPRVAVYTDNELAFGITELFSDDKSNNISI